MKRPIDRFKLLMQLENVKMPWLENRTGISRKRWTNVKAEHSEMRADEIEALCKIWPEYTMWIASGIEQPDAGQISPLTKRTQDSWMT
jgi:hypothetical protein